MRTLCAIAALWLPAGLALAKTSYTVTVDGLSGGLVVEIRTPAVDAATKFQMPNWAPGSYRLVESFRNVRDFAAWADGKEAPVAREDDNTWTVKAEPGQEVRVRYALPGRIAAGTVHWSGPSTYLYVVGRLAEPIELSLRLPDGWDSACGLDELKRHHYFAPGYDVLADNPVTVGTFVRDSYTVEGVPHQIVYYGADASKVDRSAVVKLCEHITQAQSDFWGGLPFRKYVWHFTPMDAPDGGWGLEHLSSTQIGLATGLGPGAVSVCSHEYFHAWNVKRIRSAVLGPFDYLTLPKTGALWWLEGVTDYYADLLLFRYGRFDEDYFRRNIVQNVARTRANERRMEVSPYDSSYRVGEASNGRGNSQGFGVNYYNTGWVVGMCLDIEMRSATGGKHSLDDVCRALWELCKDDRPGFAEDEIRKQLVRFGGPRLGDAYDRWVMQPGELPVEEQLAKMGLQMATVQRQVGDLGLVATPDQAAGMFKVNQAVGPAEGLVQPGDFVASVDGRPLAPQGRGGQGFRAAQDRLAPGSTVKVGIVRGGEEKTVELTVGSRSIPESTITELGTPSEAVKKLREGWYRAGKKPLAG